MQTWLYRIWIITLIIVLGQAAFYYNDLPNKMATHFDINGTPDGWDTKSDFFLIWISIIIMLNIMSIITRTLFDKLPKWLYNIPNREYWFETKERKKYMHSVLCAMMDGIFAGTNLLFIILMKYTYDINLFDSSSINMWLGIVIMLPITLFSAIWGIMKLNSFIIEE